MDDYVEVLLTLNGKPCGMCFSKSIFDMEPEYIVRVIATEVFKLANELVNS